MDKIKNRLRNLSLRKSIVLYIIIFIVIAALLSIGITNICRNVKEQIFATYQYTGERYYLTNDAGEQLGDGVLISNENISYSTRDKQMLQAINMIEIITVPLSFSFCMLIAVFTFYHMKLKKPLVILDKASDRITHNDLNFTIAYKNQDEMGRLCASFEKMRFSLEQNNRLMWRQMEQRKRLNAAFAHDLRTPLTVLKGYSEILQLEDERFVVKETALAMSKHINRLERYVDSMSDLQRMEDILPDYQEIDMNGFLNHIEQMVRIICEKSAKGCIFNAHTVSLKSVFDVEMISQVVENLVSNATRYASSNVEIKISEWSNMISITVSDDGKGFSAEGLENAVDPYYTENSDKSKHFGLGLYTCNLLCEHHNGSLKIRNTDKGAEIIALFKKADKQ